MTCDCFWFWPLPALTFQRVLDGRAKESCLEMHTFPWFLNQSSQERARHISTTLTPRRPTTTMKNPELPGLLHLSPSTFVDYVLRQLKNYGLKSFKCITVKVCTGGTCHFCLSQVLKALEGTLTLSDIPEATPHSSASVKGQSLVQDSGQAGTLA